MSSLGLDLVEIATSPTVHSAAALVAYVLTLGAIGLILSTRRSLRRPKNVSQSEPHESPSHESTLALFTTEEIQHRGLSCGRNECVATTTGTQSCAHYRALLSYLEDFLAKPHADVGRAGPVCPFVPLSLKKQTVLVGMVRTARPSSFSIDDMVVLMRRQRERFLTMEPTSGRLKLYKAIVIGFPDIADDDAPALIDHVQRRLKTEFTECGMMIGEFHRLNKTPGLRNPAFCPLQTPIPALAIRFMVPTDVLFLKHDAAYLKAFLSTIPESASNAPYRAEAQQAMDVLASGN